jgi:hypothetical protein
LFGLFVQSLKNSDSESYIFPSDINLTDTDFTKATDEEENIKLKNSCVKSFADECTAANVFYKVRSVDEKFLPSIIDNSAFADIMICDAERFPTHYSFETLLFHSHCSILLVPETYTNIENIILSYDDKTSSIHAIKQFAYLFSFYKHLPVYFVSVLPKDVDELQYEDLVNEWLPLHYPTAEIKILKGEPKKELTHFINSYSNSLVILGAFGRSSLSRFFKESIAYSFLEETTATLFLAHE